MADEIAGVVSGHSEHKVVTACVSENPDNWWRMVMMLAVSVRNLGGSLATSPLRTYFVRGLAGRNRELLEEVGAEVIDVDPFPSPIPHANKLRMFEDHAVRGEGALIALDSDIIVVGDLSTEVNPDALRGLTNGACPFDGELWGTWLEHRGLPRPARQYTMGRSATTVPVPYMCSGVLLVPKKFCQDLATAWASQVLALVEAFDAPPGANLPTLPPDGRFFTDQLALSCAIIEAGIPFDPLPLGCNFRPGLPNMALSGVGHIHPLKAVHYHRWGLRPDGFLKPPQFLPLTTEFERVNRLTAAHIGATYRPVLDEPPSDLETVRLASAAVRRRAGAAVRRKAPRLVDHVRRAPARP